MTKLMVSNNWQQISWTDAEGDEFCIGRKRARVDVEDSEQAQASPAKKKSRAGKNIEHCYSLLSRNLSAYYMPNTTEFPNPADLWRPVKKTKVNDEWLPNEISPHLFLVKVLVKELNSKPLFPEVLRETVRARDIKNQHCTCKTTEFCACGRCYYLSCPGETQLLNKLKSVNKDAYEELKMFVGAGEPDNRALQKMTDAPHYPSLKHACNRLRAEIWAYNRRMNALSVVMSPSSWIEQLLLCKNSFSAEKVLRESEEFLPRHVCWNKIIDEVDDLIAQGFTEDKIYSQLYSLFRQLSAKRGLEPLPPPPLPK